MGEGIDKLLMVLDYLFRILVLVVIPAAVILTKQLFRLSKNQALLALRTETLEQRVNCLPGEKETEKLAGSIDVLNQKINGFGESVDRLERTVSRHEDYLLNGGK